MAIRLFTAFFKIILMIFFRGPEFTRTRNFGFYVKAFFFQLGDEFICDFFLFLIQVKNPRPVLRSNVQALTVQLAKILRLKKQFRQLLIADFVGVIDDFNRLGMAGLLAADLFISRLSRRPARVSDRGGYYPRLFFEVVLSTPETTRCEYGPAGFFLLSRKFQRNRINTRQDSTS